MAKRIVMTPEIKEECREAFMDELEKALSTGRFADGKLSFTKSLAEVDRKAKVYFSEAAYMKMTALLREFSKEVAWHMVAYRIPDGNGEYDEDEYYIKDILVYPQTVTGASVAMDEEKYGQWTMAGVMAEDDRFNHLFGQGHSHVHMHVSPSSVDLTHQEAILDMLGPEDFYIFMIWNKSLNAYIRIFDMKKNILFETADCSYAVMDDTIGLAKFISQAKEIVVEEKPAITSYGAYGAGYGHGRSPVYTPANCGAYNPIGGAGGKNNKSSKKDTGKGGTKGGSKQRVKFEAGANNACDLQEEFCDAEGNPVGMGPFDVHEGPFWQTT